MNRHALYHEPKSKFAYPYDEEVLHVRFRSAKGDLASVTAIAFDPYSYIPIGNGEWEFDLTKRKYLDMVKEHSDELFDYWFCEVNHVDTLRIRYAFVLKNEEEEIFYGPHTTCSMEEYEKIAENGSQYFNFPYINEEDVFKAPKWVEDIVWYQIFPERFNRSELGPEAKGMIPWDSNKVVDNSMVFGGNLLGVIEKLDYLEQLGVTGIYFTPMFESPSTHKYDTTDYYKIDPAFGTNEDFKTLVKESHKRGIKVMLDGVFNHCGYYHPFWQDVIKNGKDSKYYDCFYLEDSYVSLTDEKEVYGEPSSEQLKKVNYRAFGTSPMMPKWNTGNPIAREHLIGVGTYWAEEYDIDGWRLDVSNEVSHDFWRAFRKSVKAVDEDIYIIGENWDNSYPWVAGDQFDAVMNYELLGNIWNYIGVTNTRESYKVNKFLIELGKYMVNYPKNVIPVMFNMMDSHDTARVLTVCDQDIRKAKLIYLLQFILAGSPSLLYGSEIGLEGNFETARGCMVFDEYTKANPLYRFLKELIGLRNNHKVFKALDYNIEMIDELRNSFMMTKEYKGEELFIIINNSDKSHNYRREGKVSKINVEPYGYYVEVNGVEVLS